MSGRDWFVISTALLDGVLILRCSKTGDYGIVKNPTAEEWQLAFHAPSNPYRWHEPERVELLNRAGGAP